MLTLLFRPIDTAVLIYFRFFAGVLLALELLSRPSFGLLNSIGAAAGFAVAVGYRQRFASIILCTSFAYLFSLVPSSTELQLYLLVSFWLNFFPVKRQRAQSWLYFILVFHAVLAYVQSALDRLAPANADIIVLAALCFNCSIIPLLMLRRTRKVAFVMACLFHIVNAVISGSGMFPWFSIMLTALFFGTSWPRYFTWFDDFFVEFKEFQIQVTRKHQLIAVGVVAYCIFLLILPLRNHWEATELVSLLGQ